MRTPPSDRLEIAGRAVPMPRTKAGRVALGTALLAGGVFGFLPVLGFWMIPLGLLVLSRDVPQARRWNRRLRVWWARRQRARAGAGVAR